MNNIDKEAFERWWHNEGSGMLRYNDEDVAEWVHRMAEIAWMNGSEVVRNTISLDRCCFSCAHAQPTRHKFEVTCQNENALHWHGLPARPSGAMVWPGVPVHKLFGCKLWEAAW